MKSELQTSTEAGAHAVEGSRRALVVAYCVPPHAAIGTHRTLRLLSYLAECGWNVDVLTIRPEAYLAGTPTDQELLARIPASATVVRTGAFRGLSALGRWLEPVKRAIRGKGVAASTVPPSAAPAASAAPKPSLKTLVEELCAMPDKDIGWLIPAVAGAARAFSRTRPDVIFSSAPPWTGHLVASALASMWKRPWVADFRDPWTRSPWGRYTTPSMKRLGARLERAVIERADAVLFTTETARDEFASHYGPALAGKFHAVANGCDASEFQAAPARTPGEPFVLLHAGSLYGGRSPLPLLNAVARLCAERPELRQQLRVRFLGSTGAPGIDAPRVCADLGIGEVVEFVGRVSRRVSLEQMQQASALLILQAGLNLAIPGKLYEYFAAGRPVLALCEEGEMAHVIRASGAGLVSPPADEEAIAVSLRQLLRQEREQAEGPWRPVDPEWYDGRIRASETARVLNAVIEGPSSRARGRRLHRVETT